MYLNKGFSLIEMILVLGLSSLSFVGVLNYEKRKTESLRAESVGQQFEEVGKALSSYIVRENSNLGTVIPVGTTVTIPLTVLQGTTSGPYIGRQYLPSTYNPTSGFGINYVIQIRNNGPNSLTGMVVSNLPVTDETGQVRYDWIGYALRKAGSQAGSAFFTGASVTGLNGGWNITNTTFPAITTAGQIAYRSQYQNNYDDIYLRRDGAFPMTGDFNMGNFNIGSATDISYNGWLYGNNALLNNLRTGYILNTGNMRNEGNIEVLGSGSFDSLYVTKVATVGKVQLTDVVTLGGACSPTGLISKDASGSVLSCQSGFWKPQGSKISPNEIYASSPTNLYLTGCYSPITYMTIPQPGYYVIEVAALGYRYSGSYVNLQAFFFNPAGQAVCSGGDNIPQGTGPTYFSPKSTCIQHLNAGSAYFYTIGSDASNCATSDLNMLFNIWAKIRLLQAD